MAKKKRKTVKVEIPVPDIAPPKLDRRHVEKAARSMGRFQATMQKNTRNIAYVAAVVVAVAAIYGLTGAIQTEDEPTVYQPQTRIVTERVPETLSFSDYMENFRDYDGLSVTLKGMLSNMVETGGGQGTLGVYVYKVVDDYGNAIQLSGLTSQQRSLFVKGEVTQEVFEVSGTLKAGYAEFEIIVDSITPAVRKVTLLERTVPI